MVQNYNRVEALPPLIENRYYGREHLVYLYYIDMLKSDFSLKEIKDILDSLNTEGDILSLHRKIIAFRENMLRFRQEYLMNIKNMCTTIDEEKMLTMIEVSNIKMFVWCAV